MDKYTFGECINCGFNKPLKNDRCCKCNEILENISGKKEDLKMFENSEYPDFIKDLFK